MKKMDEDIDHPTPLNVYDFTIFDVEKRTIEDVKTFMIEYGKKWGFQTEKCPTTETLHYQCRISLKVKKRFKTMLNTLNDVFGKGFGKVTITSDANKLSLFYVTKEKTRVNGPWKDSDKIIRIPYKYWKHETWNETQEYVLKEIKTQDYRQICCIVGSQGGEGKSTIAINLAMKGDALRLPSTLDTAEDMIQFAYHFCEEGEENRKTIFLDIPRTIETEKQKKPWKKMVYWD